MPRPEAPEGSIRIFVGNLPKHVPPHQLEESLRTTLCVYGEIFDVFVKRLDGAALGYAFVTFTREEEIHATGLLSAEITISGSLLSIKEEDGRFKATGGKGDKPAAVGKGGKKGAAVVPMVSETKVFVGGLPRNCRDEILRDYFSQFGEVADAFVTKNPEGITKGFGFVEFRSAAVCEGVLSGHHQIEGKDVSVRSAAPKPQKVETWEAPVPTAMGGTAKGGSGAAKGGWASPSVKGGGGWGREEPTGKGGGGWGREEPAGKGGGGWAREEPAGKGGGGWGREPAGKGGGGWAREEPAGKGGGGWAREEPAGKGGGGWGREEPAGKGGGGWVREEQTWKTGGDWGWEDAAMGGGGWGGSDESATRGGWGGGWSEEPAPPKGGGKGKSAAAFTGGKGAADSYPSKGGKSAAYTGPPLRAVVKPMKVAERSYDSYGTDGAYGSSKGKTAGKSSYGGGGSTAKGVGIGKGAAQSAGKGKAQKGYQPY